MDRIILYQTKRLGSGCYYLFPGEDLFDRLTLLRKRGVRSAQAWIQDETGARINQIGGIEPIDGADDARIKYQVWAEKEE